MNDNKNEETVTRAELERLRADYQLSVAENQERLARMIKDERVVKAKFFGLGGVFGVVMSVLAMGVYNASQDEDDEDDYVYVEVIEESE